MSVVGSTPDREVGFSPVSVAVSPRLLLVMAVRVGESPIKLPTYIPMLIISVRCGVLFDFMVLKTWRSISVKKSFCV